MLMINKMRINSTMAPSLNGFCTQCMAYFKVSNTNVTLLFEGWNISSSAVLVGSCIGVFFLSILSECVRSMRIRLYMSSNKQSVKITPQSPAGSEVNSRKNVASNESLNFGSTETLQPAQRGKTERKQEHPFTIRHVIQVLLHVVQLVLGYLLMLIVMTFNVWLGIAVVLGLGTGYFMCNRSVLSVLTTNVSIPMKIVQ
ncbi:probable low affinity copper uptake protein 2 [Actinia tenebrosa]|uniref:Copper transport protein n=1 Tax=Actinia tenebrosa TaxID=6105 RepID=A0A6P8HUD1_ACTTE|nr:probable low affinity copper uptake protein 2 [Actinia tenebrosa]